MAARGVDALTDRELLSLLTEDEQSAEALLAAYGGLRVSARRRPPV